MVPQIAVRGKQILCETCASLFTRKIPVPWDFPTGFMIHVQLTFLNSSVNIEYSSGSTLTGHILFAGGTVWGA